MFEHVKDNQFKLLAETTGETSKGYYTAVIDRETPISRAPKVVVDPMISAYIQWIFQFNPYQYANIYEIDMIRKKLGVGLISKFGGISGVKRIIANLIDKSKATKENPYITSLIKTRNAEEENNIPGSFTTIMKQIVSGSPAYKAKFLQSVLDIYNLTTWGKANGAGYITWKNE